MSFFGVSHRIVAVHEMSLTCRRRRQDARGFFIWQPQNPGQEITQSFAIITLVALQILLRLMVAISAAKALNFTAIFVGQDAANLMDLRNGAKKTPDTFFMFFSHPLIR